MDMLKVYGKPCGYYSSVAFIFCDLMHITSLLLTSCNANSDSRKNDIAKAILELGHLIKEEEILTLLKEMSMQREIYN
jgi:hypothetical protein